MVTGSAFIHEQFETSPETIEQVLRPAELLLTPTDRFYENYGIANGPARFNGTHLWDRLEGFLNMAGLHQVLSITAQNLP